MGSCVSQVEPDDEIYTFSQFSNDLSEDNEPKRKRQCTDKFFLYFMITILTVFSIFLIYCATIGDINRTIHGYDNCGNVCGHQNPRNGAEDFSCVGKDMSKLPFLVDQGSSRKCVEHCPNGLVEIFGRCIDGNAETIAAEKSGFKTFAEDLHLCSAEIVYMTMITFVLVFIIVLLFRYCTGCFIWCLLIGASSLAVIASLGFWGAYAKTQVKDEKGVYLCFASMFSIFSLIIMLLIFVMRKRIKMVIQLFQEASKAISAVPLLLLQPNVTFLAFGITFAFSSYVLLLLLTAGDLTQIGENHYDYVSNQGVVATAMLMFITLIWLMYFYTGCQDMIVSGTIASWYFVRDKTRLGSPILYSTHNVIRYHLGTVAFGSLIMLIMQIIKMIIESIKKRMRQMGCCLCVELLSCVFNNIQELIQYLSKLAYIMTAMHGVPFCRGGKQAVKMLVNNGMKVLCLNSIGSFILFLVHFIVVVAVVIIGVFMLDKPGVNNLAGPLFVVAFIALCMSKCFLTIYDTAIDTIFLCFCEDSEQNDGISKPYFMSKELMLFVENSKKALAYLDKSTEADNNTAEAWSANGNDHGRNLRNQQVSAPIA